MNILWGRDGVCVLSASKGDDTHSTTERGVRGGYISGRQTWYGTRSAQG